MEALRITIVFVPVLFISARAPGVDFETPVVIHNGTIIQASGRIIENGTIVIDKGRFVAVGETVEVPPDGEMLDATGLVIYPGFIDANTHAGITRKEPADEERLAVEDEHPDVREGPHSATVQALRRLMHPAWKAEESFDPKAAKTEDSRRLGFTAALISPRPAIMSGSSAVIELGDLPLRRSIIRSEVALHAAFVTSAPDAPPQTDATRYPVTTMGAVAAFRQILLDAQWHKALLLWTARHPRQERPPIDRDLESLWPVLEGLRPVVFIANKENEIHRALDVAAEFGIKPVIAGGKEAWKAAERLKREGVQVILSLNWPDDPATKHKKKDAEIKPEESPQGQAGQGAEWKLLFDDKWEQRPFEPQRLINERIRLWAEQVDNARMLHQAGVTFAFSSFELKSAGELPKKLRQTLKRGLPESAAIAALTINAAVVLGVSEQVGDITPGRLANLTVMTKPLSDEKSKVEWVFISGKHYPVAEEKLEAPKTPDAQTKDQATEAPASQPTQTQPTEPVRVGEPIVVEGAPTFACEFEVDRKPPTRSNGNLLLKNATLLTITHGEMPQTDLLIRNGRIAGIGKNLSAPAGISLVDLNGYFVIPGIIDVHSHMCTDGGLNESSLSVTCEVRARDVIDPKDPGAFRALAGGVTAIHTMHGSANTIGGQNATLRLKYGKPATEWLFGEAPPTVKFALGENVKQSNWGTRGTRFPNSRMGVEAVLRRSLDAARKYQQDQASYAKARAVDEDPRPLRRDLRLEALAAVHDGNLWVHCHCYRADEVLRLLAVAEDYGFRISVLQHILEGYRIIPEIARHGCGASTFSDWWAYKIEAFDAIPHNAARMLQGGVNATVNSDSHELIRHLNVEAAKSLRFGGLSANDALKLITLNAALQMGVENQVGSIEPGKFADLAVFDGHPLDTFSRCVFTLIDGEIYFQHPRFNFVQPITPRAQKQFPPLREPLAIEPSVNHVYWINGATIHPVNSAPIENGVLVVEGGKVAWVGTVGDRRPPPGATIIAAAGLHVYPGLINAGTELGLIEIDSVAGSVDKTEIGTFQPDLDVLWGYNPLSAIVEVSRSEGVTAAMILAGGSAVAPRAGVARLTGWSTPEAAIEREVGLPVSLPSLPVEYPRDMTEEEKKKDEESKKEHRKKLLQIEDFFRKARHYADVAARAPDPGTVIDRDSRLEAMLPYMRGQKPVIMRADSYKAIVEALAFAEKYKLRPIIFGGREAWKLADELAARNIDVILAGSMIYPGGEFEPWDSVYATAATLAKAGVRFCFATQEASLTKQLGLEAGMAVAHGLDEERALRAITLDSAAILGLAASHGSLEAGKVADVMICTDSPLQACNQVVGLFIDGEPIDLANKHTRLDEQFRSRPAPKLPPTPNLRGRPALRLP